MTVVPNGWQLRTLGELAATQPGSITDGPFGSRLTSAHYSSAGARVVRLQNIGDGVFKAADAFIPLDYFKDLRRHEVHPGDLLVASLGDDPPRSCLAPADLGPAIVKADCIRVRLSEDVDHSWVAYAMRSPAVKKFATAQMHGVGRLRLGLKGIRAIPIPVPPIAEQRRIVEILDDYFSRLDAADSYVAASLDRVGSLRTAHFAALMAASEPVSDIALANLLEVPLANGRSVPSRDGGFPVLRLTALRGGTVDTRESKDGDWSAEDARPFLVKKGDFLVARGNGSLRLVGRGALVTSVPNEVAYPDTMIRIRPDATLLHPEYLQLAWNAPHVRRQIESVARTTAGIYKINQQHVRGFRLPLLDMPGQHRVVAVTADASAAHDRLRDALRRAQRRSAVLRCGLLDAAFNGRLIGRAGDTDLAEELASTGAS